MRNSFGTSPNAGHASWLLIFTKSTYKFRMTSLQNSSSNFKSLILVAAIRHLICNFNDYGSFVEAGCFIEECPSALICKFIGVHWYIIQYQLRLDECKGFTRRKCYILFINNAAPISFGLRLDVRSHAVNYLFLDWPLALSVTLVGGRSCGFYKEWRL